MCGFRIEGMIGNLKTRKKFQARGAKERLIKERMPKASKGEHEQEWLQKIVNYLVTQIGRALGELLSPDSVYFV